MRAREFKPKQNQLVIFDIDDTLLHTTAKINVVKDGRVVRSLSNQEFNNYKLGPGEEFDFGEFRDAAKFEEESVPIGPMLDKLHSDLAAGHDVVMLTARSDFDNQKAVWRTFKRHGIDINRDVHLYRAGNLPGDEPPAYKKAVHVVKWLKTGRYNHVTMYDDSEKNLTVFKGLEEKFPNVKFEAHHVSPEGTTRQIDEGETENKDMFTDMFRRFLPLAMNIIGLKSLPRMVFLTSVQDEDQPTFGRYVNDEKTLYVALANRHPNDILRTVAHELTHFKQDTEHQLNAYSGETGSKEENEAHAVAGVVMRHFNKTYPEFLKAKPVILESKLLSKPTPSVKELAEKWNVSTTQVLKQLSIGIEVELEHTDDPKVAQEIALDHLNERLDYYEMLKKFDENFADGRNPQDKGDSKRYRVPTKGKISTLRKIAKQGGRRGQLAHWMANMRSGKNKKK